MNKLKQVLSKKRTWLAIGALVTTLGAPQQVEMCVDFLGNVLAAGDKTHFEKQN